ncbi:MAG: ABC transporter permease [Roseivirga sp.]|nr:ABC transporter permease [Roseivirga sp.]
MLRLFKKDQILFWSDKQAVALSFLLPIVLISLFAFTFGGFGNNSNSSEPTELLVVDLDQTPFSESLITALDTAAYFKVIKVGFDPANEKVSTGDAPFALVLHKGLNDSSIQKKPLPFELLYDLAKGMEVRMVRPVLTGHLTQLTNSSSQEIPTVRPPEKFRLELTSLVGETKEANLGLIQAVCGTAILMLLFSVSGLGASILEEKENGTLSRLLYSPISANTVLFAKMLSTFSLAFIQLSIMFIFSWLVFGLDIFINLPALILMITCTAFAVSSFGIFLASIAKTRAQAQSLSTLIILIMSSIGGSIIPMFAMPAIMKKVAVISVNYWGIQGFFDIFWRDLGMVEMLPKMLILLGMGAVMTLISLRFFNKNVLKLV